MQAAAFFCTVRMSMTRDTIWLGGSDGTGVSFVKRAHHTLWTLRTLKAACCQVPELSLLTLEWLILGHPERRIWVLVSTIVPKMSDEGCAMS